MRAVRARCVMPVPPPTLPAMGLNVLNQPILTFEAAQGPSAKEGGPGSAPHPRLAFLRRSGSAPRQLPQAADLTEAGAQGVERSGAGAVRGV